MSDMPKELYIFPLDGLNGEAAAVETFYEGTVKYIRADLAQPPAPDANEATEAWEHLLAEIQAHGGVHNSLHEGTLETLNRHIRHSTPDVEREAALAAFERLYEDARGSTDDYMAQAADRDIVRRALISAPPRPDN